uniref:Diguanylate cyclase/phosphodiesterase (GGDEF & EAL domains) with PAS/PAC sensor(S) n=1 Tax=Rheinheimera sp. BAL341 TaxID=1708203 RepID=A0A486XW66_9GAMM
MKAYLQRPWFAAFLYAVFGLLWITTSDQILVWLISDVELLSRYQSYKGYFYVALTAVLAWFLLSQRQQFSRSLSESENKFAATFEHAAIGIAHVALDGKFIRANAILCRLLGYSEAQLKTLTFQQITHQDDLLKDEQALANLLARKIQQYTL